MGMWKEYHLSIEGIWNGYKNSILKVKGLGCGAEPPNIKLFGVLPRGVSDALTVAIPEVCWMSWLLYQ